MREYNDVDWFNEEQNRSANADIHLDECSNFNIATVPFKNKTIVVNENSPNQKKEDTVTVELNKDKFAAFVSVMKMMKYSCQDLFIRDGKISQLNSKKSMFFEIDLTPILGNASLVIGGISSKFDILSMFRTQGVDVYLDINSKGYTFRDAQSKIHNRKPIETFLEQTAMTWRQVHDRLLIDTTRRIFSYVWQKRMLDRVLQCVRSLSAPIVRIECMGNIIVCKTQSLDNASTTQIDLLTLEDEVDDASLNGVVAPFPSMCFINFIQGGIVEIESELFHRQDIAHPSAVLQLSGILPVSGVEKPISVVIYSSAYFSSMNAEFPGNII